MLMRITAVVALFSFAALLSAQNDPYGRITGQVKDSTGAAAPAAAVTLRNLDTNVSTSTVTNGEGFYEISQLNPGSYRIAIVLKGFKQYDRGPIELHLGDVLSIDATLELGSFSEKVIVTADAAAVETTNASLGQVVQHQNITDLPLPAGSPLYLLQLAPGVAAGTPPTLPWLPNAVNNLSGALAGGTRSGASEYMLDGTPNMTQGGQTAFAPPPEMIQEVRVQTVAYDASVGHYTGALVNMAVKTGTNSVHGDAVYSYTNRALMARDFFTNRSIYDLTTGPVTQQKIDTFWPGNEISHYRVSVGGPVYIPKLYDGRNRTFWMTGVEPLYRAKAEPNFFTVPTAQERQGDFSQLLGLGSAYQIYDPASITPTTTGHTTRQPLVGNIIPPSRIDPLAAKLMTYYPMPNVSGSKDFQNNYYDAQMRTGPYYGVISRFDQVVNQNNRFYLTASWSSTDVNFQQAFHNIARGQILHRGYAALSADDVLILRPDLVLDVRAGVTRYMMDQHPESFGFNLASLGFAPSLVKSLDPATTSLPLISPTGYASIGDTSGSTNPTTYYNFASTLSHSRAAHSLRLGVDYRILQENDYNYGAVSPSIDFAAMWTKGPTDTSGASPIGQGLASLLFGLPTGGTKDVNASYAQESRYLGLFLQDDWRVRPNLTVNLGLRYEVDFPMTERYNRSTRGFDFTTPNPIQAAAQAAYALNPLPELPASRFSTPGGLLFAGINGQPRGIWDTRTNQWAPRFGIAWALRPTTIVRTGYGIFYSALGADTSNVKQQGYNQATALQPSLDNGVTFHATLENPFPDGWLAPVGASQGLATYVGRGPGFFDPTRRDPYLQQWSFGLQQQLGSLVMEAGYVGNRGAHLGEDQNYNSIPAQYLSTSLYRDNNVINYLAQTVPNPFLNIPQFAGSNLLGKTVARSQLLKPFPEFQGLTATTDGGASWYHSLQTRVQKRFSHGVMFTASYTWSKFMESMDKLNPTDPRPEHVISGADRPQVFVVSTIYELPFGRGKRWLSSASGWRNQVAGGWQIQGIYQGQSGPPLAWGNFFFYGDVHNITLPVSQRTPDEWFNVNAGFQRASALQPANNIRIFPSRLNNVRGDGYNNFNLSLFKNFQIHERWKLQFRAEAIDALNHAMFDVPNTDPSSTLFGQVSGVSGGQQRQIFVGAKLHW